MSTPSFTAWRKGLASLGWLLAIGGGLGTLGFFLQQQNVLPRFFYPLLFPLLLGGAAGYLARWCWPQSLKSSLSAIAIGLVAGCLVAVTETGWAYHAYRQAAQSALERSPLGQMAQAAANDEAFRPAPLHQFIKAQIARSGGWWLADVGLLCLGGLIGALTARRNPLPTTGL